MHHLFDIATLPKALMLIGFFDSAQATLYLAAFFQ
jgi:hypothetical protein